MELILRRSMCQWKEYREELPQLSYLRIPHSSDVARKRNSQHGRLDAGAAGMSAVSMLFTRGQTDLFCEYPSYSRHDCR